MTNLLVLVSIALLIIILLLLLKTKSPISETTEQIINHDLTDTEVDNINGHLKEGGKYRIDVGAGNTARLFTFIDILLFDLNSSNNDLILDHQKNIDTVEFLLNLPLGKIKHTPPHIAMSKQQDSIALSARIQADFMDPVKAGHAFTPIQLGKEDICPPPTGGGQQRGTQPDAEARAHFLWNPKAAQYVMNMSQKLTTNVYLTDPVGQRLLPEIIDGVVYSFEQAIINNQRSGYHLVTFIINDLETNKVGTFEQLILV